MKTTIIAFLVCVAALSCHASEEDYALITSVQFEAETTVNTFGKVLVSVDLMNGQSGPLFSSLVVEMNGKKHSVPANQLSRMSRAYYSTLKVSSEVGYPERGIGPYLYIRFDGHAGSKPQNYLVIFDKTGFKELKAMDIQQAESTVSSKAAPSASSDVR